MGVITLRTVSQLPFFTTCPTQMGLPEHIYTGCSLRIILRPKLPALTNPQIFVGDGGGRLGGFRLVPGFVSSPCSGRTGGVFIRIISAVERQETRELVTEEGKTKVSGGRFDMGSMMISCGLHQPARQWFPVETKRSNMCPATPDP